MIKEYLDSLVPPGRRKALRASLWKLLNHDDDLVERAYYAILMAGQDLLPDAWPGKEPGQADCNRFRHALSMGNDVRIHLFSGVIQEALDATDGDVVLAEGILPEILRERASRDFPFNARKARQASRYFFTHDVAGIARAADIPVQTHPKAKFVELLDTALDILRAAYPEKPGRPSIEDSSRWLARNYVSALAKVRGDENPE